MKAPDEITLKLTPELEEMFKEAHQSIKDLLARIEKCEALLEISKRDRKSPFEFCRRDSRGAGYLRSPAAKDQ